MSVNVGYVLLRLALAHCCLICIHLGRRKTFWPLVLVPASTSGVLARPK